MQRNLPNMELCIPKIVRELHLAAKMYDIKPAY